MAVLSTSKESTSRSRKRFVLAGSPATFITTLWAAIANRWPALVARLRPFSYDLSPYSVRVWSADTIHMIAPSLSAVSGGPAAPAPTRGHHRSEVQKGEVSPCATSLQ